MSSFSVYVAIAIFTSIAGLVAAWFLIKVPRSPAAC